ncbi:VOC family protein [Ornithinibacillus scapharcae]|uniref:VOC family protein n=1 Tax=Ornithinibacillus scapharcae TaxID=1147159 RepID=UPI000225B2C9|nr:VOC family protein [Ornithinibacillus scapharcae]
MIGSIGQIMLYVHDQDEAMRFWTEAVGFSVIAEEESPEFRWIEIAPPNGGTSLVLHNKDKIAQMEPELNLDTPSIMFYTNDLEQLHQELTVKNITVGDIVEMPNGRVFNFADYEENYFAVMEKK